MLDRIARLMAASHPEADEEVRFARTARAKAAHEQFRREFSPGERAMLLSAASRSEMLFLALASGEWDRAVRALRGYVLRCVPREKHSEYRSLVVKLEVLTPLGLEGELDRTPVLQVAAAA